MAWVVGVVGLALPADAAAPVLHVRARSRLLLESISRTPSGARIAVRLVDALSGEALGRRTVAISIDGANGATGFYRYAEPTDWSGRVEFRAPLLAGQYELRIASGSDADHAAPDPVTHALDLGRRQPCLAISVPPSLAPEATTLSIAITATDCELMPGFSPPADVRYRVDVDGVGVAEGELSGGRATVELPGYRLGAVGREVEVKVTLPADARYAERSQSAQVALLASSQISLDEATRGDGGYRVSGRLRFAEVAVGSGALELYEEDAADRPIARQAATGSGPFVLERVPLAEGAHRLRVRFVPHSALLVGSFSAPLTVVVRVTPPLGWLWPPALALCVGALLPMLRRSKSRVPGPRPPRRPAIPSPAATSGMRLLVRVAGRLTPLAVAVETDAGVVHTGADGMVEIDPRSTYVACAPPGYLPRRLELAARPSGVLVLDLVSRREQAYAAFLGAAHRLGRGVALDGERATPRQVLEAVSHKTLVAEPLPALAIDLERLYFGSADAPIDEALANLTARCDAVAPPRAAPPDGA